jgi:nucleoside-diphosphate-sugar epimerase
MKIFVSGIAGFIGSHLAEKLKELGHEVFGVDNFNSYYNPQIKRENARVLESKNIKVIEGNLLNINLDEILKDVEFIFHPAAQPGNSKDTSLETYVTNNIFLTDRLLSSAKKLQNLKFLVNICTSSVYGYEATSSEAELPKPVSPYGVTKLAAEQLVLANVRENNINACSLRLFSVFGPRERTDKLFPKLFDSALNGVEFPLFEGSSEHERSYTYIKDAINGISSVLNSYEELNEEIINIGSNKAITTREAIKAVEEIVGNKIIFKNLPRRAGDQLKTCANIDKAMSVLNYSPKYDTISGVNEMYEYIKNS